MKTNHKLSLLQALLLVGCALVLALHRHLADPSGAELLLVALAAAAVCALCAAGVEKTRCKLQLKPAALDKGAFALIAGAGFLFLISAALTLLKHGIYEVLPLVLMVFSAASGVVTLMRLPVRDEGETAAVFSLVPLFYLSFFLLTFYRGNGDNPHLLQFGYEIAVILLLMVSFYSSVAGRFEAPKPYFRVIFSSLGLLFVLQQLIYTALSPRVLVVVSGFTPATLAMLAAFALLLALGLFYPPTRDVFPIILSKEKEEKTEENE